MFAVPENTVALSTSLTSAHPSRIALSYAANRDSWKHLLRYDPVERFSALVDRVGPYEVWLMSWLPGQATDLHDHGSATGAFTVVSGTLTERVVRSGAELALRPGQSRVFAPDYVHQVINNGIDPAVSVHVYLGAREMHTYES